MGLGTPKNQASLELKDAAMGNSKIKFVLSVKPFVCWFPQQTLINATSP